MQSAVVDALGDLLVGIDVEFVGGRDLSAVTAEDAGDICIVRSTPADSVAPQLEVRLDRRLSAVVTSERGGSLQELLNRMPDAGLEVTRRYEGATTVGAHLQRTIRDEVAAEILASYLAARSCTSIGSELIAETLTYLGELASTRVEAHNLTHGVLITEIWEDEPRLHFRYPADIRRAKRAPLLFDGQRSVLAVDPQGHARSELHWRRLQDLARKSSLGPAGALVGAGSLVAAATEAFGGVGMFVRADGTIWTFADGQPLLVRRGERWTAFPLRLSTSLANLIGSESPAADLVADTAIIVSVQAHGAILAIVDDAAALSDAVPVKDRFDLRNESDPAGMRPETRLHHLIDTEDLDAHGLARLATLDGATVVDLDAHLLAYGAIVTANDSQHEGARTAAARTLSESALVVVKVSVDGDITLFQGGSEVITLLPSTSNRR